MRKLLFILPVIFLLGCSDPKIDASNKSNLKTSMDEVRNSLPEDKREKFDNAVKLLAFSTIDLKGIFTGNMPTAEETEKKMILALNGKTGQQVIDEAQQKIEARKEKEKEQALIEIEKLKDERDSSNYSASELEKFKVIESRFYMQEQKYGRAKPVIELTVINNTEFPISRAYFKGTIASADRSIPWLVESFNYEIAGGLEPNEQVTWSLLPNMFSKWGTVNAPNDSILTLEVTQLDGVNKEVLYTTNNFSDKDAKRLAKLEEQYSF